jgi:cobaltochelatase CobS
MFFHVHSGNRHAVRKLLTAAGTPAVEVRVMKNGQLGKALFEAVETGRIYADAAQAACSDVRTTAASDDAIPSEETSAVSTAGIVPATSTVPVPSGNAAEAVSALQALMSALTPKANPLDESAIRGIVLEQLREANQRPAVIEIKAGDITLGKVEGGTTHAKFETVLKAINARVAGRRLHVWMVGPSGSGKSFIQSQAALASNLPYYSTGAIQTKYELVGYNSPNGDPSTLQTPFRKAFETGGVFGWDDCDASDPRAFCAFNEALANGRFAFPDKMVDQHPDFVAIASANTWGTGATADYVGRNKIDAATLSRFVRIEIDYDEVMERDMVGPKHASWVRFVQNIRGAVKREGIKVLVTPRHSLQGAALSEAGLPREQVERMTVFAGLDSETVSKLRRAA